MACPPHSCLRYVEVYERVVRRNGGKILLSTFDYDQTKVEGPPHSVPESTVRQLFPEKGWSVEVLSTEPYDMADNKKFQNVPVKEVVFLITRK